MAQTTIYTIHHDSDEKTTITVSKWVADILQVLFSDVHRHIQDLYDDVTKKFPDLSRLARGEWVRRILLAEVSRYVEDF